MKNPKLVVTHQFAGYAVGDEINDPAAVQTILDGDNAGHVVKVVPSDSATEAVQDTSTGKASEAGKSAKGK